MTYEFTLEDVGVAEVRAMLQRYLQQFPAGGTDADLRSLRRLLRQLQDHEAARSPGTTLFRSGDGTVHIADAPGPPGGLWLRWTATNGYHHGTFEAGLEPEELTTFREHMERVLDDGGGEARLGGDFDSAMLETRWFSRTDSWWFLWKLTIMSDGSVVGGLWGESSYGTTADLRALIRDLRERESADADG